MKRLSLKMKLTLMYTFFMILLTCAANVIDVYIRYLRKKIDEGHDTKLIHTVRGAGYVLRTD